MWAVLSNDGSYIVAADWHAKKLHGSSEWVYCCGSQGYRSVVGIVDGPNHKLQCGRLALTSFNVVDGPNQKLDGYR